MPYIKVITATESWSCPESGVYKIICVGSGGSGSVSGGVGGSGGMSIGFVSLTAGTTVNCAVSGASSFGSYFTAAAGTTTLPPLTSQDESSCSKYAVGGCGGYTPDGVYGGYGAISGYITASGVVSASTAMPATKNGGFPGMTGSGYGAGGGYSYNGTAGSCTAGSTGAIIIQLV